MSAFANYLHSRDCKLGLYVGAATNTCEQRTGSWGFYDQDAALVASFGTDAIKFEQCSGAPIPGSLGYHTIRLTAEMWLSGMAKTSRRMLLNISSGEAQPWMAAELTSWRGSGDWGDANDPYESLYKDFLHHIDTASAHPELAGPGHWNDPDALCAFVAGKREFWRSVFGMYCILASPLILTSFPSDYSATNQPMTVVTNADAIAINQDAAGIQGTMVSSSGPRGAGGNQEMWVKPLGTSNGLSKAVGLLNTDTNTAHTMTVYWTNIGLPSGAATVRDCWAHSIVGYFTNSFTTNVGAWDMSLLKFSSGIVAPLKPGPN
jgi:alpha-galactosidase